MNFERERTVTRVIKAFDTQCYADPPSVGEIMATMRTRAECFSFAWSLPLSIRPAIVGALAWAYPYRGSYEFATSEAIARINRERGLRWTQAAALTLVALVNAANPSTRFSTVTAYRTVANALGIDTEQGGIWESYLQTLL